jgi:hypothetical protein
LEIRVLITLPALQGTVTITDIKRFAVLAGRIAAVLTMTALLEKFAKTRDMGSQIIAI